MVLWTNGQGKCRVSLERGEVLVVLSVVALIMIVCCTIVWQTVRVSSQSKTEQGELLVRDGVLIASIVQ